MQSSANMARWQEVVDAAPDFARAVQEVFDRHAHKTMATLRKNGAPRISGTEMEFREGDIWIGSMPGSMKVRDLQRDPRVAIHSTSEDPPKENPSSWIGDAKISGRAEQVTGGAPGAHSFRIDLDEVVRIQVVKDPTERLRIETWTAASGLTTRDRT